MEEVVVTCALDGDEAFTLGRGEFVEFVAMPVADDPIGGAVDDEEWLLHLANAVDVLEAVVWKNGDAREGAKGRGEGGDENDSDVIFLGGEPAGWATADGLARQNNALRWVAELASEMIVGGLDSGVATVFTGASGAGAVAGVVVGHDPETEFVEFLHDGVDRSKVFGISV